MVETRCNIFRTILGQFGSRDIELGLAHGYHRDSLNRGFEDNFRYFLGILDNLRDNL